MGEFDIEISVTQMEMIVQDLMLNILSGLCDERPELVRLTKEQEKERSERFKELLTKIPNPIIKR